MATSAESQRSLGEILRELTDGIRDLLRKEGELARAEIKSAVDHARGALVLFGAAFLLGIAGVVLAEVAAFEALALALPRWAAALIVAVVTLGAAGALALVALKRSKRIEPIPTRAIEEGERSGREIKDRLQEGMG